MVGLAAVETKDSEDEYLVGWIKDDEEDTWYIQCSPKRCPLFNLEILYDANEYAKRGYELAVHMMIRLIVTFDAKEGFTQNLKLRLVLQEVRNPSQS